MADAVVGIVANPMSGRDIRRLVAQASVFPTAEKANMVQRLLTAFGAVGVDRAIVATDLGGISAAVLRAVSRRIPDRDGPWPEVDFLDGEALTETAADTTSAVQRMVAAGARAVVCLGGDGTARVAAAACGDVPLLPMSTGTNNAFPQMLEATVAGLAVGLVVTDAVDVDRSTTRALLLEVTAAGRIETALVDVCVTTATHVGARALWDPAALTELYCTFAEPHGIGLSSVAGLLCPSPRQEPRGVALSLVPPAVAAAVVHAPIAPGLVVPVGVRDWRPLEIGEEIEVRAARGVIAVDGEREIEYAGPPAPVVRLRGDGPRVVDVRAVLADAAHRGLLRESSAALIPSERKSQRGAGA